MKTKKQLSQHFTPPAIVAELIALAGITPGMKVLEPSAGDGEFVVALAAIPDLQITAVEIDPDAVAAMRERLGQQRSRMATGPI